MSEITVRNLDFRFDKDIDYYWNPGNDDWGNFVNLITVIVPAFERFVIKTTRAAIPKIEDAGLREAADLFCRQEAQHSKQHIAHIEVLTGRYPGLKSAADEIMAAYQQLFDEESLEFNLAYAAVAELYLGPLARFMVENRDALMPAADPRIASFILWHFIEEFEHRNAALDIYSAVAGSYAFRLRSLPGIFRHLYHIKDIALAGFREHVPSSPAGVASDSIENMFAPVAKGACARLYWEWFCTLLPGHNPDNIREPAWVRQWHADYRAGVDMTVYYPGSQ